MIRYESEINLLSGGEIQVITKGRGWQNQTDYLEEMSHTYPSTTDLRKGLIREKFLMEITRWTGYALDYGGLASLISTPLFINRMLGIDPYQQITVSFFAHIYGERLSKDVGKEKPKVDSRIKAFNKTFPDLKPVNFSPREYLSTISLPRLPLLRR